MNITRLRKFNFTFPQPNEGEDLSYLQLFAKYLLQTSDLIVAASGSKLNDNNHRHRRDR